MVDHRTATTTPTRPGTSAPLARREVDLDAIQHNVSALAGRCAPAKLMVVVKANGYSHGAPEVAAAALEAGATRLGVATLAEAIELRDAGVTAPVLAWLAGPGSPYADALARGIEVAAYSCAQLGEIAEAARECGRTAIVHLKAETGMWRGGAADEWPALVALAHDHEATGLVSVLGVWSHLACADEVGHPANDDQRDRFLQAVELAEAAGLRPRLRHLANSAGTLTRPDLHFDMVRCGLAAYGVNPLSGQDSPVALRPALTVRATVTHVKDAPAGAGVSYGHTYRTAAATRLALVPIGYADGIPVLSGRTARVGLHGTSVPIAGRVCMDQLVLDVGDLPVRPGDEVTLLGPGDDGEPTAAEWAALSGRSAYEILTGLDRRRVPAAHVAPALTPAVSPPPRRPAGR